jgi:UDP-N-acetylmuramoyl-tripeptide--D-alanyl-D-alanine ligase
VQLATPGVHTASNALAAASVGFALRIRPSSIVRVLESFRARTYPAGYARLAPATAFNGARILNDTYNANPDSVAVALETLMSMRPARGGRRIAVLGDMKELGASSRAEHEQVGSSIASRWNVDVVLFHGDEMRRAHDVLKSARVSGITSEHFRRKEDLIARLMKALSPDDVVLVKGSRGMKMEEVVNALVRIPATETRSDRRGRRSRE